MRHECTPLEIHFNWKSNSTIEQNNTDKELKQNKLSPVQTLAWLITVCVFNRLLVNLKIGSEIHETNQRYEKL